ncbi:MAG: glycosyltransferase [Pseudomonadota bacterium]
MAGERNPRETIQRLRGHIAALQAERDTLKKRDWNYQAIFDRVTDRLSSEQPLPSTAPGTFKGLSFVIVYYDIPQQIERTLLTCAPAYQGVDADEIEVILVDNGSTEALPADLQERFPHVSQILRIDDQPSPVAALNAGIAAARFEMIALMIDGAHLLSPGVVQTARDIWRLFPDPVVSVPQYILGRESQNLTQQRDAFAIEEAALRELGWPDDGYRLFEYAVYPGENHGRSHIEAIESNCLITTRHVLDVSGGFDPRYDEPGGGFANLEIFSRLIHEPQNTYVIMPGEGTFHQDHRGVTTQRAPEERDQLVKQYRQRHREVTGSDLLLNARSPILYGKTRRLTQRIPTISREFGRVSNRILRQLANIYVARVRGGLTDDYNPVLSIGGVSDERLARTPLPPRGLLAEAAARNEVDESALAYLRCLRQVHHAVCPERYLEIGVDGGASLSLADCPSVGIDPAYVITRPLTAPTRLFRQTSDAFFADEGRCAELFGDGLDLAFIDGMHLAEFVLRDFIATERWMRPGGVVMFDDVLPEQMEMLDRERRFAAWCGDVYKIVPILRRHRPDLQVNVFETFIGPYRKGLAVISGLDPTNRVLEERYEAIAAEIKQGAYDVPSIEALDEMMQVEPIKGLRRAARRRTLVDLSACLARHAPPERLRGVQVPEAPKLSVVVVAYNMARELPRTLRSLSAEMQRGIEEADYEIVVVDNGSTAPADLAACVRLAPNARVITLPPGRVSPCHAVNVGISAARARRIGVMIDGARMASPGLLAAALGALADESAVVGSHGYHLGQAVQSEAIKTGYDVIEEDALLAGSGWEEDGYRLFDIAVLSKSSGMGLEALPSESNALFLHRDRWQALNGYDERFRSPGGGLANLDMWKRACEHPGATVTMLLGEGTFHQIHGGATTSAASSRRAAFDDEYQKLRGGAYRRPKVDAEFVGSAPATRTTTGNP